jgi:hypothetical protein
MDLAAVEAAEQAQRDRVTARLPGAIQGDSMSLYQRTFREYEAFCALQPVRPLPLSAAKVGDFLYSKCASVGNAASWAQWQSQTLRATELRGHPPLADSEKKVLASLELSARADIGFKSRAPPDAGRDKIRAIWAAVKPDPALSRLDWSIMVMTTVVYALTLRPGEFAESTDYSSKVAVRLRNLTIHPMSSERPYGGITLVLPVGDKTSKRMKTRQPKTVYTHGCGGDLCPVALLTTYLEVHGIDTAKHEGEPVFARLDGFGRRQQPLRVISQKQVNAALASLCARAGVERFTSRGTHSGRRTDLREDGIAAPIVTALGRWGSEQAAASYNRERSNGPLALTLHPPLLLGGVVPVRR